MNQGIYNSWQLIKAPLTCRQSMLKKIRLIFRDTGRVNVYDTANSASYMFTNELHTITTIEGEWTQRCRIWETKDERKEAEILNKFIRSLLSDGFQYALQDNTLIVHYQGEEYNFTTY